MLKPNAPALRRLLRAKPGGMTIRELQDGMDKPVCRKSIRRALENMPDVYIDRWLYGPRGQFVSVWVAVHVPAHCPYPTERYKPETRWIK